MRFVLGATHVPTLMAHFSWGYGESIGYGEEPQPDHGEKPATVTRFVEEESALLMVSYGIGLARLVVFGSRGNIMFKSKKNFFWVVGGTAAVSAY